MILTFGNHITNSFSNSLVEILGFRVICLCYEYFHLPCVWVYVFWQPCGNFFVSCHVSFLYVIKYLLEKKHWIVISGKSRPWQSYHAKYQFHGDIPTKKKTKTY